jgi:D-serine deaminase-like pyridoxal phosphate-dependent protein
MGGTPSFPIHAQRPGVQTSPGTFVYWDAGYAQKLPDLPFVIAAVLLTRVVSVVDEQTLTLDLGHKAVAAENPLPRVVFPEHPEAVPVGQSEEHLVVRVPDTWQHSPGEVWYGVPIHICPTVALYDRVFAVEDHRVTETWPVVRGREWEATLPVS